MERYSFRIVSGDSPETIRKLCLSTKFHNMTLAEITVFYAVCNIEHITIINASLKFLKKMPVQKEIFRFHENPISIANLLINALILIQSLVPQNLLYHFRLFHIHLFILSFLLQSHLIRHLGTQSVFKDSQSALEHSRDSESTRELIYSEGT